MQSGREERPWTGRSPLRLTLVARHLPRSSRDRMYEGPVFGSVDDGVLRIAWERSNTGFPRRSEIRFSAFDAAGNRLTPSDGVPLMRPVARGARPPFSTPRYTYENEIQSHRHPNHRTLRGGD